MSTFQKSKQLVRDYFDALEKSTLETLDSVMSQYIASNYLWRGVYPWREMSNLKDVVETFWKPLRTSIKHIQRRQDIFIAGKNEFGDEQWVMSMGNFMGLFDEDFLGIKATRKIVNIRYAEFNCIVDNKITKTGLFIDIIGLMDQAGAYPLPPSTGVYYNYPGPRNHNGLLFEDADESEGQKTLDLVNEMITDLDELNKSGSMTCTPELLEKTWAKDMLWYGPAGIGATYTIPRYQEQHQLPFRSSLGDKRFCGHVCRFSEGNFACFFGWPNLSNTPLGGWLGLPGGNVNAEMQVVDIYHREGDKLSENWIFIDLPYWLKQQGLDVLSRTESILNAKRP
ncbi:nuclear transport factor 2 family protein [Marinomonas sp. 15G1-11]|uniref:Nuclear transport factor 2 family protein n=1 Tax=Marinomonas phaeophyticola TaxID=3004091 RepID=A0ABT4JZF9_9GAMM|nr:nuclear transport factor 2 family protein [Marinomonas sp. 15G1-11]MCZ2722909.1 nuclear transport factor 2 family protein [Marinomonas sp. 15G1-11]